MLIIATAEILTDIYENVVIAIAIRVTPGGQEDRLPSL